MIQGVGDVVLLSDVDVDVCFYPTYNVDAVLSLEFLVSRFLSF